MPYDDQDASRPASDEADPEHPGRAGGPGSRAGLDPTRDPQRPGAPGEPRDERTPPPSSIKDSGSGGSGVAGTPPGPDTGGRPSGPDERGGGPEPL